MIPFGRDGTIYFFTGDHLRKMKVRANEDDIGIGRCLNMDEVWESLKRFEVSESTK